MPSFDPFLKFDPMLENTDIDSNPSSRENLSIVSPEDVEAEFEKEWKNADVE